MFATALAPVAAGRTLSNSVTFGTVLATFLVTAEDTDGAFSITQLEMRPGNEPPYHIHDREDETFYIVEGHLSVMADGVVHECRAGDAIFLPRGLPHTFRVRSETAKGLVIATPGGFEKYFQALGTPARKLEAPPSEERMTNYAEVAGRVAASFGVRMTPQQPAF